MHLALRWAVLLCVASMMCPSASAKEAWREDLNKFIGRGRVADLQELLTDERLDAVSEGANAWYRLVEMIERYSPFLIRRDAKAFAAINDRVLERATKQRSENERNTNYRAAWALATATRCRHLVYTGRKQGQPEWRTAADEIAKLYEDSGVSAQIAVRAAGWLGEAAAVRAEKDKELMARAREILDAVAANKPDAEDTKVALGRWYVARAAVAAARKSKSAGKAAVVEGLAYLKPHLAGEKPASALGTVHTELLGWNRSGKFGVKEAMHAKTVKRPTHGVVFKVPESAQWEGADAEKDKTGVLIQKMLGGLTRRRFNLESWEAKGKLWADRDQQISVALDDTKKLATAMVETLDQFNEIDEVLKRRKPRKAKLHKSFKDVWRIEIEGTTKEGSWVKVTGYYFTTKKATRTYYLSVREYQTEAGPDPLAAFVLENVQLRK